MHSSEKEQVPKAFFTKLKEGETIEEMTQRIATALNLPDTKAETLKIAESKKQAT